MWGTWNGLSESLRKLQCLSQLFSASGYFIIGPHWAHHVTSLSQDFLIWKIGWLPVLCRYSQRAAAIILTLKNDNISWLGGSSGFQVCFCGTQELDWCDLLMKLNRPSSYSYHRERKDSKGIVLLILCFVFTLSFRLLVLAHVRSQLTR